MGGLVTLLTDFGHSDPYVGIVHGAILRRSPNTRIVDLCHHVPAFDIATGAFFLAAARDRFPDETVHVEPVPGSAASSDTPPHSATAATPMRDGGRSRATGCADK